MGFVNEVGDLMSREDAFRDMEELGAENVRNIEKVPVEAYQVGGVHYLDMKLQPWDVIDQTFTKEEAAAFYKGNALKYIMRGGSKGPAQEDYKKAMHYIEKLIEIL